MLLEILLLIAWSVGGVTVAAGGGLGFAFLETGIPVVFGEVAADGEFLFPDS